MEMSWLVPIMNDNRWQRESPSESRRMGKDWEKMNKKSAGRYCITERHGEEQRCKTKREMET